MLILQASIAIKLKPRLLLLTNKFYFISINVIGQPSVKFFIFLSLLSQIAFDIADPSSMQDAYTRIYGLSRFEFPVCSLVAEHLTGNTWSLVRLLIRDFSQKQADYSNRRSL